jgi:hypothetical protein
LLRADPGTAPHAGGVLIIDETGDRKAGTKTAHVGRQYLGNRGKTEQGVVSVGGIWADDSLYSPVAVEPYTPAPWFAQGKAGAGFRTKPPIALEQVEPARVHVWPFRAVVADSFDGEHHGDTTGLEQRGVPYVVALKPSHAWWAPGGAAAGPRLAGISLTAVALLASLVGSAHASTAPGVAQLAPHRSPAGSVWVTLRSVNKRPMSPRQIADAGQDQVPGRRLSSQPWDIVRRHRRQRQLSVAGDHRPGHPSHRPRH